MPEEFNASEAHIAHVLLKAKQLAVKGIFKMEYHIDEKFQFTEQHVEILMVILRNRYCLSATLRWFRGEEYMCDIEWGHPWSSGTETVYNAGKEFYETAKAAEGKKVRLNVMQKRQQNYSTASKIDNNEVIEDDIDDDWLGPHPEETWSDLYEKD